MAGRLIGSFVCLTALLMPEHARSEETWEHRVDILTSMNVVGYRPAKILSSDGDAAFDAGQENAARAEVRARFRITGSWLQMDMDAYTVIPERKLMVNLAGLEFLGYVPVFERLKVPLLERVRPGFYHHSSHNFSDGSFGGGLDLNALVLDALVYRSEFDMDGAKGEYAIRANYRYYYKRRGSPYVLTEDAVVNASDVGGTDWRAETALEARHRDFRSECSLSVTGGTGGAPASAQLLLSGAFRLAPKFLGELQDHMYVGPYLGIGKNFSRTDEFGSMGVFLGIRVDLVVSEHYKSR